ncbi:MAG: Bcr/CflA family drug resistance efflux transporter [Gammaproteobacteria bacterium]|nr:Bcr/CflA family drug resistance efflux transporter [Gammaproteobacteria bacterium]
MANPTVLSKKLIVLLAVASALGPAAMQILLPALPVIQSAFAVSDDIAQLTLSLSMLAIALGTLYYGPLSDRYGRKLVMLIGLSITFLGSLACMLAKSIELLILARFVQAFGGAVGLVLARAMVRDVYEANDAARVIATLVMVMVVIPMLSPALGGELMARFGWKSVFSIVAGSSLVLFAVMLYMLPETLEEPVRFEGVSAMLSTYGLLLQSSSFRSYALCVAFVSVVFFSFIAAAPEIMVTAFGRPPTDYGYYFIMVPMGFMGGNYATRMLTKRFSINQLISLGGSIALLGISVALSFHMLGLSHPMALFVPVAIAVFGNGITLPNAQAAAINEFPQYAGSASGLTGFLQMAISAVAAQAVAWIYDGTAFPLLVMMLCASALSLCLFHVGIKSCPKTV